MYIILTLLNLRQFAKAPLEKTEHENTIYAVADLNENKHVKHIKTSKTDR